MTEDALTRFKDLGQDSVALAGLVKRVGMVVDDAVRTLGKSKLSMGGAIAALEALEATIKQCQSLVDTLSEKSPVMKFLFAGKHRDKLKDVTALLATNLRTFEFAMGVEQHSELKLIIDTLRNDLINVPLKTMRNYESQAAEMRDDVERLLEAARIAPERHSQADIARLEQGIVAAGLHKAGMVVDAAGTSQKEAEEIVAALRLELEGLHHKQRGAEEHYLEQLMAALALPQDMGGSSNSSSTRRMASAATPPHDFRCPIMKCVMRDPVTVESGHTFERQAILRHLSTGNTNPVTNKLLLNKTLTPCINLRNVIEMWLNDHGMTHEQADAVDAVGLQAGNAQPAPAVELVPVPPRLVQLPKPPLLVGQQGPQPAATTPLSLLRPAAIPPAKVVERTDLVARTARTATETALLSAAGKGSLPDVERLLFDPATNPNVHDECGQTALHLASQCRNTEVVVVLLREGANKEAKDKDGWTALVTASWHGRIEVVETLLQAGANKEAKNKYGRTALHLASQLGDTDMVEALLRAGADKEAKTNDGITALNIARGKGHTEVVEVLLQAVANNDVKTKAASAAEEGSLPEVERLLSDPTTNTTSPNMQGKAALTARMEGVEMHESAAVGTCKQVSPNPGIDLARPMTTRTTLPAAAERVDLSVRMATTWEEKLLPYAAKEGNLSEVERLLSDPATNPNVQDKDGWTALHLASGNGHTAMVAVLLWAGTDTEAKANKEGWTALHIASQNGHTEVVAALLRAGAAMDAREENGRTPLHFASATGHTKVVAALLGAGADKAAKTKDGITALHIASQNGHTDVVVSLLPSKTGKEVEHEKALLAAAKEGNLSEVERLLFDLTINPNMQDKAGLDAKNIKDMAAELCNVLCRLGPREVKGPEVIGRAHRIMHSSRGALHCSQCGAQGVSMRSHSKSHPMGWLHTF